MPATTTIDLEANTWTLLTTSDVAAMRIQNQSQTIIHIKATAGASAPNSTSGSFLLLPYSAIAADITLADLFGGVTGANRVYAFSQSPASVSVSYS